MRQLGCTSTTRDKLLKLVFTRAITGLSYFPEKKTNAKLALSISWFNFYVFVSVALFVLFINFFYFFSFFLSKCTSMFLFIFSSLNVHLFFYTQKMQVNQTDLFNYTDLEKNSEIFSCWIPFHGSYSASHCDIIIIIPRKIYFR